MRSVVRVYPGPPIRVRRSDATKQVSEVGREPFVDLDTVLRTWGCSSVGRAPALQAGGHRFDPVHLHHPSWMVLSFRTRFLGTWFQWDGEENERRVRMIALEPNQEKNTPEGRSLYAASGMFFDIVNEKNV